MDLSGPDAKALHAALRDAFPTHANLAAMLRFELDVDLAIISADTKLAATVLAVLTWANAHDMVPALLRGACTAPR